MAITLSLHYGHEDVLMETGRLFLPITPKALSAGGDAWTKYQLEKHAFDTIPPEFPEERAEIGKRIEQLGEHVILHTYGPMEGDYYIEIPPVEVATS